MQDRSFFRPEELRRFENLLVAARALAEGYFAGQHRSPFTDASAEFRDYRAYVPGDDLRQLDWRASARSDRDFVRLYQKETDRETWLLLDNSRSMGFRGTEEEDEDTLSRMAQGMNWQAAVRKRKPALPKEELLSKWEYGMYLSAALAYLTMRQGDRIGLAIGASELMACIAPAGASPHLYHLLQTLEQATPGGETRLSSVLQNLFARTRRRGVLMIFSDFLEEPENLFRSLAQFQHRGWAVVMVHILTDAERELAHTGPMRYYDPETLVSLDADPEALRAAYRTELDAWLLDLEARAKRCGFRFYSVTTGEPYTAALEKLLLAKNRRK